jgi:hypothetical protein
MSDLKGRGFSRAITFSPMYTTLHSEPASNFVLS